MEVDMAKLNKILFATTSSAICNDASRVAFRLAKKHHSKLYIFHVLGFPTHGFGSYVVDYKTGEHEYYSLEYIGRVKKEIEDTYSDNLKQLDDYKIETLAGVPYREILRIARREAVDLIIMGPHIKDAKGAMLSRNQIGCTMKSVTQKARCPVIIVGRPVKG
jgi:nucleotide-binding universal stress UspA family protein